MVEQIDWAEVYDGTDNDEKFKAFHKDNPHVLEKITGMAQRLRERGFRRIGINMLVENVRYSHMVTTGKPFKINNNFAPYYTRLIEQKDPALGALFEKRKSRADDAELREGG